MKTKRLFISTLIAAAAMGLTAYANEAATQTTPVIAETDAPEGADKLLPLADAPAAEDADASAEETQDADALELLLADDALVELDEAAAPDELSTETMMREWIARYAAAARFAGIRSVKGTGGGLSSGGAVATAGADLTVSAAAPTPSVSVPAAGTVSLADTLTRASAAGVSLDSARASDAGTVSVATASSASGTSTILPAAFFSTRSVFSAVPAAAASYSLAGSSGVSAYAAGDDTTTEDSGTTIQSTWPSNLIDSSTGRPTAPIPGFGTATLNASSTLTLSGNTIVTISGNPGSAINIDTAGHLLAVIADGTEVQFNGKFTGGGAVWFKQGRFQARNADFFNGIGDVHVSEASQLQLSAATMNIANNFFLGSVTGVDETAALRVGVWVDNTTRNRAVNATLSGVTTVLAQGTKIGFQYGSTLNISNLTGSGDINTCIWETSNNYLNISNATNYTGKINLVSGVTLNWTNATATFGGLSGTAGSAGSVAGGSYLNIAKANNDSTSFAGTVGAAGNGVTLTLTGSGTQAFTGTNYFSSVSVGAGATLDLSGSTTTLSSSILNSGTVTVSAGTRFNITSLASLRDADGNYAVISGGNVSGWDTLSTSDFTFNGSEFVDGSFGRYSDFQRGSDGKITFTETAANLVWTNAANGTWDTSTRNWTNTSTGAADAFVSYDSVEFNKSGTYTVTVASGGVTADIMKVSAGTVSFSGDTVTAIGGVSVTGGTLNLSTNVFAAGTAFNVSGGALTLGSAFALTAGTSIDVTDAGMVSGTISSMAAGSSLRLAGKTASTVTLAGTIGAAALDIQNGSLTWTHVGTSRSSAANITIGAGSTFKDVTDYKYSLTLSGTLLGSGTLYSSVPTQKGQNDGFRDVTLSGNASGFTGEWVLETASSNSGTNNRRINGVLNVSGGVFGGVINFANSSANAAGISSKLSIAQATMEIGGLKGTLSNTQVVSSTTSSALTINTVADADYTYAGQIDSSISSITKNGDGIQTLSGDNSSYTGAIMVNAGTLGAGSANALGSGAVTVKDGATLAREMENESVQIGNGTRSGSLTTEGAAILNLGAVSADTAAIAVTGEVTLSAGTIFDITDASVGGAILLSGTSITISDGGSLSKSNIYVNGYKLNQRATLTVTTENGQIAISDYTEGNNIALTWNGGVNGVWKADGAGWTATDTSEEATFQHGDDVTFSTGTNNNVTIAENLKLGTLTISDATTLSVADGSTASVATGTLSLGANLTLNGGVTLAVTTFASSIIEADSTVDYSNLSGTGTLSLGLRTDNGVGFNLSNFEGTIRVERGTGVTAASRFQLNTSTLNANARIVVADGNDLVFNDDTNKNVSNSVTFEGSGTIHVNGDNNITSGTNVCRGTLSGNVVIAGTLTKADGGVLTLSGNASISALSVSGGTLNLNGTQKVGTSLTANSGTINIGSGWTLTSTASVGGMVNIEDGGVWEVVGQNNSTSRIVGTVNVNAGGTLNIAGHDALGYKNNSAMTNATIVARGKEGNLARIVIADVSGSAGASMTFGQTFRLNGYTEVLSGVSGSSFNTFFGSVVATGTNNTISSEVKLRKAFTVQVINEGDELEISGVLSKHTDGNNGLTKTGSGTLVLSRANTYDCATTIEGGVLTVKNSSALGTGVLNAAGGTGVDSVTLKVAQDGNGNALTIENDISVSASKTLILKSANVGNKLTGTISGANGALKLASGTLEIAGTETTLKNATVSNGAVLKFNGATTTVSDKSEGIHVDGGGSLVFSSETATVGRIILNTWYSDDPTTASASAEVTGGVVNVTSDSQDGAISIGSGASKQSHRLTVSGGVLNATAGTTTLGYYSAGTLAVTGGEANLKGIAFGESRASGTLEVSNARLNLGESGIEKKSGAGTGSVSFGEGAIIGALDTWSSAANVGISLAGTVTFDTTKRVASTSKSVTADTTGTTITLAGALFGSGTLTKVGAGTLKLTGDNSAFTGNVKLSAGTLEIGHSNALGLADPYRALTINGDSELKLGGGLNVANNVVFDYSATEALTLTINAAADTELSGMLSSYAQNEIRKIGAGTLKLSGNNELFSVGTISVEEGTILAAQANALGKGTVTVGADGKLGIAAGVTITEVSGGIVLTNGAQIVVDLSNRQSETATFEVTLATNTAISLAAKAALAYSEGDVKDLTDYLELKGWDNKSGWTWSLTYENETLTLTMAIPEPSLFGLLAGVTALGFSMSSRRRRKKA